MKYIPIVHAFRAALRLNMAPSKFVLWKPANTAYTNEQILRLPRSLVDVRAKVISCVRPVQYPRRCSSRVAILQKQH